MCSVIVACNASVIKVLCNVGSRKNPALRRSLASNSSHSLSSMSQRSSYRTPKCKDRPPDPFRAEEELPLCVTETPAKQKLKTNWAGQGENPTQILKTGENATPPSENDLEEGRESSSPHKCKEEMLLIEKTVPPSTVYKKMKRNSENNLHQICANGLASCTQVRQTQDQKENKIIRKSSHSKSLCEYQSPSHHPDRDALLKARQGQTSSLRRKAFRKSSLVAITKRYKHATREEQSFAKLMTVLSILFVVCWMPQFVSKPLKIIQSVKCIYTVWYKPISNLN